ncbi:MAG TPA: carbon storage regulator [Planctomycetaceae bacterium]|nr:carbon storage regulator [Planctomycetaceae bacterium]
MLVLTRRRDESIIIDGRITVRVLKISGCQVRLGIEAPRDVSVVRTEVLERHEAPEQTPARLLEAAGAR